ncbi:hypothetical protein AB6C71_03440 [Vibrio splendidus]
MVLSNVDIEERIKNEQLINNFDRKNIGAACYELRMGDIYYDLTEDNKIIELKYGQDVIVKPGHLVVLMTVEELNLPLDIMARVISKGSLFSIGLTPICTSVDPGFNGHLGLVVQNISNKYITFPKNESLAKIDFSLLTRKTNNPYRGQHGFKTQVWPIKKQLQKNYSQVKRDNRVDSEEKEASRIIPASTANAVNKLLKYQKRTNYSIIGLIIVNALLMGAVNQNWIDITISFAINILASIVMLLMSNGMKELPEDGN